jgi:hypothetical protein
MTSMDEADASVSEMWMNSPEIQAIVDSIDVDDFSEFGAAEPTQNFGCLLEVVEDVPDAVSPEPRETNEANMQPLPQTRGEECAMNVESWVLESSSFLFPSENQTVTEVAAEITAEITAAEVDHHHACMQIALTEDDGVIHTFAVETSSTLTPLLCVNDMTTITSTSTEDAVPMGMCLWFAIQNAYYAAADRREFWTKLISISGHEGTPIVIIIKEVMKRMSDYYFDFHEQKKEKKDKTGDENTKIDPSKCRFSDVQAIVELWLMDTFCVHNLVQESSEDVKDSTALVRLANKYMDRAEAAERELTSNYNRDRTLLHLQSRKDAAPGNDLLRRAYEEVSNLKPEQFKAVFSGGSKKLYVLVQMIIAVIMFVRNDACTAQMVKNVSEDFKQAVAFIKKKPEFHEHEAESADLLTEYTILRLVNAVLPNRTSMTVVTDFVSRFVDNRGCKHGGSSGFRKHWLDELYLRITGKTRRKTYRAAAPSLPVAATYVFVDMQNDSISRPKRSREDGNGAASKVRTVESSEACTDDFCCYQNPIIAPESVPTRRQRCQDLQNSSTGNLSWYPPVPPAVQMDTHQSAAIPVNDTIQLALQGPDPFEQCQ